MSCIILRPDPQELFDQLRNMFSSTVLGGGKVIPELNEWYVVTNDYAAAEQFYAVADQMWRETNPETACCENLYKMAARDGVFPRPASHAQGYARLTGTPHASVPTYFEISTSSGIYVSTGSVPLELSAEGTVVVSIRALTPGPEMNAAGDVLTGTMITPAPGIDAEVQICGGQFCGGAAEEDCEAFRKRYIDRLAYKPRATMAWIKEKLLEFPCATRVCVREGSCCRCEPECGECGCINCGNTMNFYVLFDGVFPCGIPPQSIADDITDWMFGEHQGYGEGQVEIGVCGKIWTAKPFPVNVLIDIVGCPSTNQKQTIANDIKALFGRVCPSMPLRVRQIELIVAAVLGAEINIAARFEAANTSDQSGWITQDGATVWTTSCGDLEPACDVLPCLEEVRFTNPDMIQPPC